MAEHSGACSEVAAGPPKPRVAGSIPALGATLMRDANGAHKVYQRMTRCSCCDLPFKSCDCTVGFCTRGCARCWKHCECRKTKVIKRLG